MIGVLVALKAVSPHDATMKRALVQEESLQVDPRTELSNAKGFGVEVGSCIENLHRLSLRQRSFIA